MKLRFDAVKKELHDALYKLRSTEVERDRYKLRCASLRDQMLIGTEPRRGLCTIIKCMINNLQTEWTANVKRLHDELYDEYGDIMISDHNEKLSKKITKSIKKFVELNMRDKHYIDPVIKIKRILYTNKIKY